jgi:hypothetical protein
MMNQDNKTQRLFFHMTMQKTDNPSLYAGPV